MQEYYFAYTTNTHENISASDKGVDLLNLRIPNFGFYLYPGMLSTYLL